MSELSWLAMSVLAALPGMTPNTLPIPSDLSPSEAGQRSAWDCSACLPEEAKQSARSASAKIKQTAIAPTVPIGLPQFSDRRIIPASAQSKTSKPIPAAQSRRSPRYLPTALRPTLGSQQYQQRLAALRAGTTYTRLPAHSFWEQWSTASMQPTYDQWISLLRAEAQSMAGGQGKNALSILLGDSISQWFPADRLSSERFWLNQGISGDTTSGVLRRLSLFAHTRPHTIHLMIGINDLRRGASNQEVLTNIHTIVRQLQHQHPQAQIVLYSILPTRLPSLPSQRIQQLNHTIAAIAQHTESQYVDLQTHFSDETGILRRDLTTDGLHLSDLGYSLWSWLLQTVG